MRLLLATTMAATTTIAASNATLGPMMMKHLPTSSEQSDPLSFSNQEQESLHDVLAAFTWCHGVAVDGLKKEEKEKEVKCKDV